MKEHYLVSINLLQIYKLKDILKAIILKDYLHQKYSLKVYKVENNFLIRVMLLKKMDIQIVDLQKELTIQQQHIMVLFLVIHKLLYLYNMVNHHMILETINLQKSTTIHVKTKTSLKRSFQTKIQLYFKSHLQFKRYQNKSYSN